MDIAFLQVHLKNNWFVSLTV